MANSPQGWQYPHPPTYPQGPAALGSMPPSARPPALRRAVSLMYAGAAVGAVSDIVNGLTRHSVMFYSYSSTSSNTVAVHEASYVASGIIAAIITGGVWLWMAWKTGAGRNWARVLSSVLFGFACLGLLGAVSSLGNYGGTGLAFAIILTLAQWGVGLAALIQLWRPESSEFFALAKQAKLASAYGAAYSGYPPTGYGQPGYGPPPQSGETTGQEPS
jgi:hypothetical protein